MIQTTIFDFISDNPKKVFHPVGVLKSYLRDLNDEAIFEAIKSEVKKERVATATILDYLFEIDRRSLHLKRGFSSLFEYCVKELKYPEASAYRRTKAVNLMKRIPSVHEKIKTGELSLNHASKIEAFVTTGENRSKNDSEKQKLRHELLNTVTEKPATEPKNADGKTPTQKLEEKMAELVPLQPKADRKRKINSKQTAINLTFDEETMSQLKDLELWFSHQLANATKDGNANSKLIALCISKIHMAEFKKRNMNKASEKTEASLYCGSEKARKLDKGENISKLQGPLSRESEQTKVTVLSPHPKKQTRFIPILWRKAVLKRAQFHCQYADPKTGQRCQSKYMLQIDHKKPLSQGGPHHPDNLNLLCFRHHRMKTQSESLFRLN